jgi:ubiquinone/menaquinone biosynthesis C-methylase UbiE
LRAHDHPVVRLFGEQRAREIGRLLGEWRPESALDVGCGDGFGMQAMAPLVLSPIHGCDRSQSMLDANPAPASNLTPCDAYELPFETGSFELVYCWELLHHLAEPNRAVAEMARVASSGVLICEPNRLNPAMAVFGIAFPSERGTLRFDAGTVRRLLTEARLRDVVCETVGWFTPNRTPQRLAQFLVHLPYRVPLLGLYAIGFGSHRHPAAGAAL